jgi:hypothetical protein
MIRSYHRLRCGQALEKGDYKDPSKHCVFRLSRLPKADAFASPIVLNEINPGSFERPCEGNRDFPVNDLGSTNSRDDHFRGVG